MSWPADVEFSINQTSGVKEVESIILDPLKFTASITRNISQPTRAFPNVDIRLSLEAIQVQRLYIQWP